MPVLYRSARLPFCWRLTPIATGVTCVSGRSMRSGRLMATWQRQRADLISGYYVESSWKASDRVGLFARFSQWNTAATLAGKEDDRQVNIGFNYGLNPRVVLKADLQDSNQPGGLGDGLNLGVGLSF